MNSEEFQQLQQNCIEGSKRNADLLGKLRNLMEGIQSEAKDNPKTTPELSSLLDEALDGLDAAVDRAEAFANELKENAKDEGAGWV